MVHWRAGKSTPHEPILSQINPVHGFPTDLMLILILSSYLRLGLVGGRYPSCFPTKTLYAPPLPPIRATHPACLLYHLVNTWSGLQIIWHWEYTNCEHLILILASLIYTECSSYGAERPLKTIRTKIMYQSTYTNNVTCECTCVSVLHLITAIVRRWSSQW